jgi:transcriptional antiterminator RfaH
MKNWFVVYTQSRNEELASEHLNRQGFDVYFPRYRKTRSHARRRDVVAAPLFPRYIFVGFDAMNAAWRSIRSTRGVIDLVRHGVDPVPVPEGAIDEIRAREDDGGYILLGKHLRLARGDRFRIDSGPFASCEAIFEAKKDEERVIALLSMLGREVSVVLPIGAVAPAG